MLTSRLIAVIKKKKPEILKIKFSRFGSGRFGSASMWGLFITSLNGDLSWMLYISYTACSFKKVSSSKG